jgi:stress response protein SCP2
MSPPPRYLRLFDVQKYREIQPVIEGIDRRNADAEDVIFLLKAAKEVAETNDFIIYNDPDQDEGCPEEMQMSEDLLQRPIQSQQIYQAGAFSLQRFVTDLDRTRTNYIGESIVDDSGDLQYLKIYGLSAVQTRRAYLLQELDRHNWQLEKAAIALNETMPNINSPFASNSHPANKNHFHPLVEELQPIQTAIHHQFE